MKITPLAHQVIGKLALIGLLFASFALTPSYAAELVGKPVPVGAQAATAAATQASGEAEVAAKNAAAANGAVADKAAPIVSAAPTAPKESIAPSEPAPSEPPEAPELCASNGVMQNSDDIRKAIDELRDSIHHEMPSGFGGISLGPDVIVPVFAITFLFGGPILLLMVLAILHYRAKARRQQNINMNIDKLLAEGRDIPLEMLLGEEAAVMKPAMPARPGIVLATSRDDATMQKGVRNIGLGTGWLIFLTIMFSIEIGSFGFIFIGLGISQLVIWKLSSANTGTVPKAETPESLKAQD